MTVYKPLNFCQIKLLIYLFTNYYYCNLVLHHHFPASNFIISNIHTHKKKCIYLFRIIVSLIIIVFSIA